MSEVAMQCFLESNEPENVVWVFESIPAWKGSRTQPNPFLSILILILILTSLCLTYSTLNPIPAWKGQRSQILSANHNTLSITPTPYHQTLPHSQAISSNTIFEHHLTHPPHPTPPHPPCDEHITGQRTQRHAALLIQALVSLGK